MTTATEYLESVAPEFTGDARIDAFLEIAALQMDSGKWGNVYTLAVAYLAAHLLTESADDGGASATLAGALTAKHAGDLSESYATPSGGTVTRDDALLSTTKYGRAFCRLRNSRAARAPRTIRPGI